ncbi:extensin [Streptomyces sp. CHD11]|nr:extensin [Streptomyces sp. CHD11]
MPSVQRAAVADPSPAAEASVTRLHAPGSPALPPLPVPVQRLAVPAALKSLWKRAVGAPAQTPHTPPAHAPEPPPPYDPGPPPPYDAGSPPPYDPGGQPPPYSPHDPYPGAGGGSRAGGSFDPRALSDGQIDELTHRLLGPLTRLLRTELRMDRERIGRLRDPRT